MIWSFILAAGGILGIWLAGRKNLWGWALGLFMQVLWVIFGLVTEQYGFLLSAAGYGWVYAHNWAKWRREQKAITPVPLTPGQVEDAIQRLYAQRVRERQATDGR